jgi:hypothetical protein
VKKIAIIVTFLLLAKPVLPVLDYWVNYKYIANELCENQDKPELECNGKCHLKKELAKAATEESSNSKDKKQVSKQEIETLFYQETYQFKSKKINIVSTETTTYYFNNYFYLNSSQIFHPPTIIS